MSDPRPPGDEPAPDDESEDVAIVAWRVPEPSPANDTVVGFTALAAGIAGAVFGIAVLVDWPTGTQAGALAVALGCLGVAVRRYFADRYPDVEGLERRPDPEPVDTRVEAIGPVPRRRLLRRALVAAAGVVALGLAAPLRALLTSDGPGYRATAWAAGVRLVDSDGRILRPDHVAHGGMVTAWPEGAVRHETSQVALVRLRDGQPAEPTVLDWVVDGNLIAYSQLCTHAGCPVALFRAGDDDLFCPCHQSTFDARHGAAVGFGPAARPLPQLPLATNDDGELVALDEFPDAVGPLPG